MGRPLWRDLLSPSETRKEARLSSGEAFKEESSFNDLHTVAYQNIINGNSFNIDECRPSIKLVYNMKEYHANNQN